MPTSLLPLAEVMNDHRTFLPYIGLVIGMAGAVSLLINRAVKFAMPAKIAVTCAVVLLLCANAYATFQRNKVWKTEETLWHDVVLKSPRNGRGLMNYGNTLLVKGDYAGALDYYPSRPTVHAAVFRAVDQSRDCGRCDETERGSRAAFQGGIAIRADQPR